LGWGDLVQGLEVEVDFEGEVMGGLPFLDISFFSHYYLPTHMEPNSGLPPFTSSKYRQIIETRVQNTP
jgi:hypothetical protein